jgi:hypothetical protein
MGMKLGDELLDEWMNGVCGFEHSPLFSPLISVPLADFYVGLLFVSLFWQFSFVIWREGCGD